MTAFINNRNILLTFHQICFLLFVETLRANSKHLIISDQRQRQKKANLNLCANPDERPMSDRIIFWLLALRFYEYDAYYFAIYVY